MLSTEIRTIQLFEGSVMPLGAHWVEEERAYNFSIYSQHARSVKLLFTKRSRRRLTSVSTCLNKLRNCLVAAITAAVVWRGLVCAV